MNTTTTTCTAPNCEKHGTPKTTGYIIYDQMTPEQEAENERNFEAYMNRVNSL